MSNLAYKLESLNDLEKKLIVTIPVDVIKKAYNKACNSVVSKVRIDGFRKGKVPRTVIEKRFDAHLQDEVLQKLVPEYFEKAVKEADLNVATQPSFDKIDFQKEKPISFNAVFSAWPEFETNVESQLKIEKEEVLISEEERNTKKETLLDQAATYEKSNKEKTEKGDRLILDFKAIVEGEDTFEQKDHIYDLGSKQFYPEIEKGLTGMGCNEEKVIEFILPEETTSEEAKGKNLVFTCTIKEIQIKKQPKLEESFFQRFGEAVKTEVDFSKFIDDQIIKEKESLLKTKYRAAAKEQLEKVLTFNVPKALIEGEKKTQMQVIERDNKELSQEEKEKQATEKALASLRIQHFISIKQEKDNLKIDEDAVRQRFIFTSQMMQMNPEELLRQEYGKQVYQSTYLNILEEVVLDNIIEKIL